MKLSKSVTTFNRYRDEIPCMASLIAQVVSRSSSLKFGSRRIPVALRLLSSGSVYLRAFGLTLLTQNVMGVMLAITATSCDAASDTHTARVGDPVSPSASASIYADGSLKASAGLPQLPMLFSRYAERPPWRVAGVDYHVGVANGTVLKDPSVSENLPPGTSLNDHTVVVTGSNVTIRDFDFSTGTGFGIYIASGASGTKIINNVFFDRSPGSPIPVNVAPGASDTYIAYNTMDGGGANGNQSFGEMVYNFGSGLVLEYNLLKNAPQHFVTTSGGPLIYRFNLAQDGGWFPGSHLNFLQFSGGISLRPQVRYNMFVQRRTFSPGEGIQMYVNFDGKIEDGDIGNNVMISDDTKVVDGMARGPAVSYWIHAGSNSQYPSPASGTVHDNYLDLSDTYGAFYPGLRGFTAFNNVILAGSHHGSQ